MKKGKQILDLDNQSCYTEKKSEWIWFTWWV